MYQPSPAPDKRLLFYFFAWPCWFLTFLGGLGPGAGAALLLGAHSVAALHVPGVLDGYVVVGARDLVARGGRCVRHCLSGKGRGGWGGGMIVALM